MPSKRQRTVSSPSPPPPVALPEPDLTDRTFRGIMRNGHMIRQVMEPFFEEVGLTVATWVAIRVLYRQEEKTGKPVRLVDLSKLMRIRQPTLTASVNKLVLLGYVERIASPENRRDRLARVTPKGREMIESVLVSHRGKIQDLLRVWTPGEKHQVLGLLEKLAAHLETILQSTEGVDVQRTAP